MQILGQRVERRVQGGRKEVVFYFQKGNLGNPLATPLPSHRFVAVTAVAGCQRSGIRFRTKSQGSVTASEGTVSESGVTNT